jgi:hypothetical protein
MVKRAPSGAPFKYFPDSDPPASGEYAKSPTFAFAGEHVSAQGHPFPKYLCQLAIQHL